MLRRTTAVLPLAVGPWTGGGFRAINGSEWDLGVRPMGADRNRRRPGNQRPRTQREMKKPSREKPRPAGLFFLCGGGKPQLAEISRTIRATIAARIVPWLARRVPVLIIKSELTARSVARPGVPILMVHRPTAFYNRLATAGLDGFCESYQAGDWDADNLLLLLTKLLECSGGAAWAGGRSLRRYLGKPLPDSSEDIIEHVRQNVSYHYDISNDFFACFLDETMTYSAALFEEDADGQPVAGAELLLDAQRRKIDRLLDLTAVGEGTRLLGIGTGWGYLAVLAAQRGAHVRTATLSAEQAKYAQHRVTGAGVGDRVAVELRDFRELGGDTETYDAVISMGMVEAIGDRRWPACFSLLDQVLADGGRVGLQVMTMRHDRFLSARRRQTWINKHVLPGFLMPSVPALETAVSHHSALKVLDSKAFGLHFAATLRIWRERFEAQARQIELLGFDDAFQRTWRFFLASSEASFQTGLCDVYQYILARD